MARLCASTMVLQAVIFGYSLIASICFGYGEENASNLYTVWSHSYPPTVIKPYDWSYLRVHLPPRFASWTFTLDTDVQLDMRSISKSHISRLPMMCFREGGPSLPDFSEASLKGLVLDQVHNISTIQPQTMQKCYALQGNITFILTNEQVAEGVLYIGLFNGIGPTRTQSKMINRGRPYTFRAVATVKACKNTTLCGQHCNKSLYQLSCNQSISNQATCRNSTDACHADMTPKLFTLNVDNFSEELILTMKNVTSNGRSINLKSGQVSLMCYARTGATPTENLFDYSTDIAKNPLMITSPRLGTWYFYIVPVSHYGIPGEPRQIVPELCYSLGWEIPKWLLGKACPNCSSERLNTVKERNPFVYLDGKKFPVTNIPLEVLRSKPLQGNNSIDYAWIYFLVEVPQDATKRNIRIQLVSNMSLSYGVYARFGGVPSIDIWDYYYANQTSNSSNGSLFKVYDSSEKRLHFEVVYAQEGNWIIGLRHRVSWMRSRSQTNLSVSLESCPAGCSGYGICQRAIGLKACSFCQCHLFYGGYDCSVELVSKTEQKLHQKFLVGSNAAALLPAICALWQQSYADWVVFLSSGIASAIYHACDAGWICLLRYDLLQFLDFWLSFVAVISTFVYMATTNEAVKGVIKSVVWIVTALMALDNATSFRNIAFVIIIGAVCLVAALLVEISANYRSLSAFFHRTTKVRSFLGPPLKKLYRSFRWWFVALGFAALALAATSWNLEDSENYWMWHSIWHIAIYTAASFFIYSKVKANRDGGSKDNAEGDLLLVSNESSRNYASGHCRC